MKRLFIETSLFTDKIEDLKNKDLEKTVKDLILRNPKAGDVIPGTSGLRKLRVGKGSLGKRGGFRVIYLDIEEAEVTYLFIIYDKKQVGDLTPTMKKGFKHLVEAIKSEYKNNKR